MSDGEDMVFVPVAREVLVRLLEKPQRDTMFGVGVLIRGRCDYCGRLGWLRHVARKWNTDLCDECQELEFDE